MKALTLPAISLAIFPTFALAGSQAALEQTQAFFAALESGELGQIEALMAEDVVNTIPFDASGATTEDVFRIFDGREQVMAYFAQAQQFIPEVAFVDPQITISASGDTAFVETRGNMQLADGRAYENLYVWRLDFENDQIVEITEYFNPVTAAIAFGRPLGPQESN
ncbi:MAG: nuclear transport factor 2 family protein [Pseudomonadota bacterium]